MSVNASMVTLARESRGLTQSALARKIGLGQGTLSKIENGQVQCSEDTLEKLSQALKYPQQFFENEFTPRNLPVSFFRKYKSFSGSLIRQIRADLNIVRIHVRALTRSAELPRTRVPVLDSEFEYDPEQCANDLRVAWGIPPGPIQNLTRTLEDNGVVIVSRPFGTRKIDGTSTYDQELDLPPIILVNGQIPGDRLRFTLGHELAHIILHSAQLIPEGDIEKEAHRFAAEFLMPRVDIRDEFPTRLNLEKLAHMKSRWKTSIQALVMRAEYLGQISGRQKAILFSQLSKLGYRKTEPVEIPRDEPALFRDLVKVHLAELNYTMDELCSLLTIEPSEFQSRYFDNKPFLRLLH